VSAEQRIRYTYTKGLVPLCARARGPSCAFTGSDSGKWSGCHRHHRKSNFNKN